MLPLLFGGGAQLTPALSPETGLTFLSQRALPGGAVEIVYACEGSRGDLPGKPAEPV